MTKAILIEALKNMPDDTEILIYLPWEDEAAEEDENISSLAYVDKVFAPPQVMEDWNRDLSRIGAEMPVAILRIA